MLPLASIDAARRDFLHFYFTSGVAGSNAGFYQNRLALRNVRSTVITLMPLRSLPRILQTRRPRTSPDAPTTPPGTFRNLQTSPETFRKLQRSPGISGLEFALCELPHRNSDANRMLALALRGQELHKPRVVLCQHDVLRVARLLPLAIADDGLSENT